MPIIRWILAFIIIVGAVLFALVNPTPVTFTYSPFHNPKEFPLYFIVLSFLGGGFLLGAFMAWMSMGEIRADRRRLKKENKQLERDINEANEKLTEALSKQRLSPLPPKINFDDDE